MPTESLRELNERVLHIERELSAMKLETADNRAELSEKIAGLGTKVEAVQATAEGVKADTSEMVTLLKGMKLLGALTKWVGLPGGVVYGAGKFLKWWT